MFNGWENFYLLIGTASATLIGLLFVVATLTSGLDRSRIMRGVGLYLTPTVFHFAVILTISALAMARHPAAWLISAVLGATALAGLAGAVRSCIGIRARTAGMPLPHWSDFWLYGALPAAFYLALAAIAIASATRAGWVAWATPALLLGLLLLGIRNAWDLVTSMAPARRRDV